MSGANESQQQLGQLQQQLDAEIQQTATYLNKLWNEQILPELAEVPRPDSYFIFPHESKLSPEERAQKQEQDFQNDLKRYFRDNFSTQNIPQNHRPFFSLGSTIHKLMAADDALRLDAMKFAIALAIYTGLLNIRDQRYNQPHDLQRALENISQEELARTYQDSFSKKRENYTLELLAAKTNDSILHKIYVGLKYLAHPFVLLVGKTDWLWAKSDEEKLVERQIQRSQKHQSNNDAESSQHPVTSKVS